MVTFRQVARAYVASARAAEKDRNRRAKEAARLYKEQQKQNEIANAYETVRRYEEYIDVLMSVHKSCADKIDWQQVEDDEEPTRPEKKQIHEDFARQELKDFTPSLFHKIFGSKRKIRSLEQAIEDAKIQDQFDFDSLKEAHDDWQRIQGIAKGVQGNKPQSFVDALDYFKPFDEISTLGSKIDFSFNEDTAEINLHINNSEVIPNYVVSVTKSGKLSQKDMPKTKFNELYQDYVCGGLLRIAREIYAHLPLQMVVIHVLAKMVNTSTGHLEDTPIVSALVPPDTIDTLNFDSLDQSDSMKNFVHNMKFSKTNGFSQVDKLSIPINTIQRQTK